MSLLVVGSIALDSIKTPFGAVSDTLGGSATHFSVSASFFTSVQLVGVVGDDFPPSHVAFLKTRGIDCEGLERAAGDTFRWWGEYGQQLNHAKTLDTKLNVFETFRPALPKNYCKPTSLFLANIDPAIQWDVLHQVARPGIVASDTMNFWIQGKRDALLRTLKDIDLLIINDGEASLLADECNLIKATREILTMGPKWLVIKRGEYGAVLFDGTTFFSTPAYPLETIRDPTGAGDSFAGGFMGYLSRVGKKDGATLRRAVVYGSVMASFNVEGFGLDRLRTLTRQEIVARYQAFHALTAFEAGPVLFDEVHEVHGKTHAV